MKLNRITVSTCLLLLGVLTTPAADIVWTNIAGGNWSNATNWSPNTVPGATDTALITNAGTYTVTVNAAVAVTNLTLGGMSGTQTVANPGFTLTLNGASYVGTNGVFAMDDGAVLTGAGNLNIAGLLNWTGGTMSGTGRTIITNGATLTISGFSYGKTLTRNLDLYGNGTFTGTTFNAGSGIFFNVFPSATFDYLGDAGMSWTGGGGFATLSNAGLVRKTGGAGQANLGLILNNTGIVRSQSGDLRFTLGGLSSGNFDAVGSATVSFGGGTHTLTNGVSFTASGGGYHRCDGGTLAFETHYTFNPQFNLDIGGTLGGSRDVNFTTTLNWLGGTMGGTGRTIVTNGATLTISGFSYGKTLTRNLDLYGTGTFTGTTFNAGSGIFFNVFPSATFDYLGDAGMSWTGGGGFATLSNAGLVRKTGGAGQANLGLILNNTGIVRSQSGDLRFTVGGLSSGNFDAVGSATVSFGGGTHTVTNGVSFTASGGGYHRCDGGTLAFETHYTFNPQFNLDIGGTLGGSRDVNFTTTLNWLGGTMGGTGRTIVTNGATLTISGFSYGKTLTRNLDLYGTGTFTGTTFNAGSGIFFNVFPSATFDYLGDAGMSWTGGGGFATLSNAGLVRKTGGAGQANLGLILNNTGIVRSQSGDLRFTVGGLSSGNFDAVGSATVSFGGGTHTVTNGVSFTASGGGYHRCDGGTLAFETHYTFNPQFNLDIGGTLGGSRDVNFTTTLNWLGGTMGGTGRTIVTNGATLTISGFSYGKTLTRNLDLYGTGTFTGTTFNAGSGIFFNVFPSATFDYLGDAGMSWTGGGGFATLSNAGLVRKTGGAGQANLGLILNNTGIVRSQSGDLRFTVGGLSSGNFDAVSGATVSFGGGTHTVTNGVSFTASGGGYHRCDGGTLAFETHYTFNPQFNLDIGGTLGGSRDVNFTTTLNWLGGTMGGTGRTIVTNGATLTISGFSYGKTLTRNLDLYGTGTFTGTTFNAGSGAVFTVFGGATYDWLADSAMGWTGGGGLPVLLNGGTVRKTAGGGTGTCGFIVTNTGTFNSQSGTLNFTTTYRQNSGVTRLAGGHYQAVLLDINGGSLTGIGNIVGPVRNNGEIQPGSPLGFLNVTNSTPVNFTNTTGGTYFIQLGGANAGVNQDTIRVNGNAILSGTLNVSFTNGYVPALGTVHTAMTFTARSGIFTNSNASLLGLVEVYTPTNFLLVASNGLPQVAFTVEAGPTQSVCRPFALSAQAFDLDGTITNLSILVNGSPIVSGTNTSVETTLEIDFPGNYTLEARAYDDKGALAISNRPVELYAPLHVLTLGGVRDTNNFKFCMVGQTGSNYLVQATTNLTIPTSNWVSLGLMESTNGIFRYFDNGTITNRPARYYRAQQQ